MQVKSKFILIILALGLVSCASVENRKMVNKSSISFHGGQYNESSWSDNLNFKRFSWFSEATMTHDLLVANLDKKSPFIKWLGTDEDLLKKCSQLYLAMTYANDMSKDVDAEVRTKMFDQGAKEYVLVDFNKEIKAHPNFHDFSLKNHRIYGFCAAKDLKIGVHVPGYKLVKIQNI